MPSRFLVARNPDQDSQLPYLPFRWLGAAAAEARAEGRLWNEEEADGEREGRRV